MWQKLLNLFRRIFPPENRGLIDEPPKPTDWVAGGISGIVFKANLPTADWRPYLPSEEVQYKRKYAGNKWWGIETKACVSFSANNVLETLLNFYIQTKQIPDEQMTFLKKNGYLDKNGLINFSDRYLAKMSNTTWRGNTMSRVANTLKNFGAVPEHLWPWDVEKTFTWNEYYKQVPQYVIDAGKEFLRYFDIQYEFVYSRVAEHLKQAPLQVAISTGCYGYNTYKGKMVPACRVGVNHCVMYDFGKYEIFDHYDPFRKWLSPYYYVPWKLKYVINFKINMELYKVEGEETLVIKNFAGDFFKIKTAPEFYPGVVRYLGIPADKPIPLIKKSEVDASHIGYLEFGMMFRDK